MKVPGTLLKFSAFFVGVALAGAVLGGLPWTPADVAVARKSVSGTTAGYKKSGYKKYKPCGHSCQVKHCTSGCGKARRTCIYCAKQDGREQLNTCKAAATSKAEVNQCKQQMKAQVRADTKNCRGVTGRCGSCCHGDYGASCTDAFEGTSGFGGYFRTVKHYGKVHRYAPDCSGGDTGGDSCAVCERDAARGLAACTKASKKVNPQDCQAAVEANLQACLARCGATTTTTTTTTATTTTTSTTTLPPPSSPGGAFLHETAAGGHP